MKRFLAILLAGLLVAVLSTSALAWEFNLKGDFVYKYDYITQTGKNGFFGPFDSGAAALFIAGNPNWAAMNGWAGARSLDGGQTGVQYGLVTGEDASFNYQRMEFYPEIRINPAVRLRGVYQIGGLSKAMGAALNNTGSSVTNPAEYSVYANSSSFGAWNPIDTGSWTQWWATAETPWGILVFGKRPSGFGTGVQYCDSGPTSESLAMVAPYGPFRIGLGGYLHRRQTFVNAPASGVVGTSTAVTGTPANAPGYQSNVSTFDGGTFPKQWDHDSERTGQPFIFVTYQSGDLDAGFIYEWIKMHDGPQARSTWGNAALPGGASQSLNTVTRDETLEDGSVYLKYNNGRFFLNTELAWARTNSHFQAPQSLAASTFLNPVAGGGSALAPTSMEAWKFGAELGAICGPAKVSLLYSWVPGPDRRAGIWISGQPWENIVNGTFVGNGQYFKPYSMLMAYQYAAGLNALDRNGEGYMTDAITYAARLDYAVAANLNVYGTFAYANRQSHGWGWGCLTPDSTQSVTLLGRTNGGAAYVPATNNGFSPGAAANGAPNIPDDNLGWEVDAGVDWKLLEGFQFTLRGAYWQPGEWFKFACVDKSQVVSGTTTVFNTVRVITPIATDGATVGAGWGINPNRSIDPIWAAQGSLLVDF